MNAPGGTSAAARAAAIALVRAIALAAGAFAAANALGGLVSRPFDTNHVWIDARPLPHALAATLLAAAGLALGAYAFAPAARCARRAGGGAAALLALAALRDAARYWQLLADGALHAGPPVPFSLVVAAALAAVALVAWRVADPPRGPRALASAALALAAVGFLAPLALMLTLGRTDYRRSADAVIVLGARAYADGTPSLSLADRARTGAELVLEGRAPLLVLSGGPGDGAVHETEAARDVALALGLRADAIELDRGGWSTADTARNVAELLRARGATSALAVSHSWHLPRVRLAFRRAELPVLTVPARETRRLAREPWFMVRESAALWAYWLGW